MRLLHQACSVFSRPLQMLFSPLHAHEQVAVVTLDISALSRNVTYGQHYQLAVYLDCKPCPTRYQCVWEVDPPTCSTPRLVLCCQPRSTSSGAPIHDAV